jgi:hypothetical protein
MVASGTPTNQSTPHLGRDWFNPMMKDAKAEKIRETRYDANTSFLDSFFLFSILARESKLE